MGGNGTGNTVILIILIIGAVVLLFGMITLIITLTKKHKQTKRISRSEENYKSQTTSQPQSIRFIELVSKSNIGAFSLYFRLLAVALVSTITLGIANPWMEVWLLKWIASKTSIDEKTLEYRGSGGKLFVNKLKWTLLFIVTLGIYGFWIPSKILKYHISQLHFEI